MFLRYEDSNEFLTEFRTQLEKQIGFSFQGMISVYLNYWLKNQLVEIFRQRADPNDVGEQTVLIKLLKIPYDGGNLNMTVEDRRKIWNLLCGQVHQYDIEPVLPESSNDTDDEEEYEVNHHYF